MHSSVAQSQHYCSTASKGGHPSAFGRSCATRLHNRNAACLGYHFSSSSDPKGNSNPHKYSLVVRSRQVPYLIRVGSENRVPGQPGIPLHGMLFMIAPNSVSGFAIRRGTTGFISENTTCRRRPIDEKPNCAWGAGQPTLPIISADGGCAVSGTYADHS